jgi:hypothetical protein
VAFEQKFVEPEAPAGAGKPGESGAN